MAERSSGMLPRPCRCMKCVHPVGMSTEEIAK